MDGWITRKCSIMDGSMDGYIDKHCKHFSISLPKSNPKPCFIFLPLPVFIIMWFACFWPLWLSIPYSRRGDVILLGFSFFSILKESSITRAGLESSLCAWSQRVRRESKKKRERNKRNHTIKQPRRRCKEAGFTQEHAEERDEITPLIWCAFCWTAWGRDASARAAAGRDAPHPQHLLHRCTHAHWYVSYRYIYTSHMGGIEIMHMHIMHALVHLILYVTYPVMFSVCMRVEHLCPGLGSMLHLLVNVWLSFSVF